MSDYTERMSNKFITTQEVADICRAPVATVRFWRHAGKGPRSFKLGRRVLYDVADVEQWLESRRDAG